MVFHHFCILTDNYNKSVDFYTKVFEGVVIKENKDFHGRDYNSWLSVGNVKLELQTPKRGEELAEDSKDFKGIVHIAFMSDDVEKEYKRLRELGINSFISKNGQDIYTVKGEKLFKLTAPEGTIIEIRDTDIGGN